MRRWMRRISTPLERIERDYGTKQKFSLTGLERAWILYDVGNSAFVLLVATLIPIFSTLWRKKAA